MAKVLRALVVVAFAAAACGGSVTGVSGKDGGAGNGVEGGGAHESGGPIDTGTKDTSIRDVASKDTTPSPDTGPTQPYDGTTGTPCTTSADCRSAHGPDVAVCSNAVFGGQDYFPTAVCILMSCSPVSNTIEHYCDGPDDPSSPGICVPSGASLAGVCLPKCTYDKKGDAPTGCQGNDRCFAYTPGTVGGVGYCWGGCKVDGDCQDGQKCQADQGLCVQGVVPPTKGFGAACTESDTNAGVCNCLYGKSTTGYCSSVCTVGDPTGCPKGATCDSIELRSLGYTTPNAGMGGYCAITCAADGGAACPSSSSCTAALAAGPDCIPP